jgi:hypothetical protein
LYSDNQWTETIWGYGEGMVRLLEGRGSVEPACGSASALELVQAAWQCLAALVGVSAAGGDGWHHAVQAAHTLLGSEAACQVLLQQPGGVCSIAEVCGVLRRCLESDDDKHALKAAAGLLRQPERLEAALAIPGFAAALVTHALAPSATRGLGADRRWGAKARLLEVLVSHISGRAALMAEGGALGRLAWMAVKGDGQSTKCSPHLAQLWAAGAEEGLAEAMVAGLAAGEEGWVKFFGWLVKERSAEEWREVEGLLKALIAAFNTSQPGAPIAPFGLYTREVPLTPLEQVLLWLLQQEGGRQLLLECDEVEEAVSAWLQRTASPQRPSPLVPLLQSDSAGAVDALDYLASSPVLARGALLSLVTSLSAFSTNVSHDEVDTLIAEWVWLHEEVQEPAVCPAEGGGSSSVDSRAGAVRNAQHFISNSAGAAGRGAATATAGGVADWCRTQCCL